MQRIFFFIFSFSFFTLSLLSQVTTFQKTYGGTYLFNEAYSAQETNDSGFIITGYTNSFGSGLEDVYLIKTTYDGSLQWTKTFGDSSGEKGYSIQQTNDGGYIISGEIWNTSYSDIYLIKTDSDGSLQWSKNYGGSSWEEGRSVKQTIDGGFIIAGRTNSFGAGNADVYLVKTSSDGTLQWTKTFGGTDGDYAYSVRQTNDGGFIIAGVTFDFGTGVYLLKTTSDGTLQWSKVYGGTGGGVGYSVQQTNDGGFILTGSTGNGAGYSDIYLVKTASDGTLQWEKTYGGWGYDYGLSVRQTIDGGFIVGGYTNSFSTNGFDDFYLAKTTSDGTLQWSKSYGETNSENGFSAQETKDGGFAITGIINFGIGHNNFYLVKTDSNGNSGCNESIPNTIVATHTTTITNPATQVSSGGIVGNPSTQTGSGGTVTTLCYTGIDEYSNDDNYINIFPNPSGGLITIQLQSNISRIEITNILGEKIYSATPLFSHLTTIDISNNSKGIYFIKVISGENMYANKIIKN